MVVYIMPLDTYIQTYKHICVHSYLTSVAFAGLPQLEDLNFHVSKF